MTTTRTMTELKKLVIGERDKKNGPAKLIIGQHEADHWATNSYWLVKAHRVATLLEHYNLPTTEAAVYEVNGTVRATGQEGPNLGTFLTDTYDQELRRTEVDGIGWVWSQGNNGLPLAVFTRPDGEHVFVNDHFHAWIVDQLHEHVRYGERWDVGSLTMRQRAGGGSPIAYYACREVKKGGHKKADGIGWEPETWETGKPELFAILMPVRKSS